MTWVRRGRWWVVAVAAAATAVVMLGQEVDRARTATLVRQGDAVPGQLVIEQASEAGVPPDSREYDAYVRSVRELLGGVMDEDRVDRDDLIVMGRRICFHLERDGIQSTRDYVREYRSQRRRLGYRVYRRLLVQGAAVAETAPATFCPEHVGTVSAEEAASLIGYED